MAEKSFKIVLADGTSIENLSLNGNNFISTTKITEDMFTDLDGVEIVDNEGNTERHEHMAFVQVNKIGKEYWFVLRDVGAEELRQMQMRANIEYIAMMTDVEL